MPRYTLWRESDNSTHGPIEARDDVHAIAIFGQNLDITFTLEEGPMVPGYMMARKDTADAAWAKPPEIPVWVVED